jgi:hypothetical protein
MKVLLVYEAVGDRNSFYVINDPSDEDLKDLTEAHGQIVGSVEDDGAAMKISDYLSPKDEYCSEPGADHNCKWKDCQIEEEDLPSAGPFDSVYVSGFFA